MQHVDLDRTYKGFCVASVKENHFDVLTASQYCRAEAVHAVNYPHCLPAHQDCWQRVLGLRKPADVPLIFSVKPR